MYIYAYNGLNRISVPKNISICDLFHFYRYCILVFDLLRRVTNIQIFFFGWNKNGYQIDKNFTNSLPNLSVNNKNDTCIMGLSIRYPFLIRIEKSG